MAGGGCFVVSPAITAKWAKGSGGPAGDECGNLAPTMRRNGDAHSGIQNEQGLVTPKENGVRRLLPVECERLQGFPDRFTELGIDDNGKEKSMSDSGRYFVLGNAVTVNVAEWIGLGIPL